MRFITPVSGFNINVSISMPQADTDPEAINLEGVSSGVEGLDTHYGILLFLLSHRIPVISPTFSLGRVGGHTFPPQPGHWQNRASQGTSNFADGSGPLFSMYVEMATELDKEMANSWKGDADGILVFVSLAIPFCSACSDLTPHRLVCFLLQLQH
jgi:hypothetical protein